MTGKARRRERVIERRDERIDMGISESEERRERERPWLVTSFY